MRGLKLEEVIETTPLSIGLIVRIAYYLGVDRSVLMSFIDQNTGEFSPDAKPAFIELCTRLMKQKLRVSHPDISPEAVTNHHVLEMVIAIRSVLRVFSKDNTFISGRLDTFLDEDSASQNNLSRYELSQLKSKISGLSSEIMIILWRLFSIDRVHLGLRKTDRYNLVFNKTLEKLKVIRDGSLFDESERLINELDDNESVFLSPRFSIDVVRGKFKAIDFGIDERVLARFKVLVFAENPNLKDYQEFIFIWNKINKFIEDYKQYLALENRLKSFIEEKQRVEKINLVLKCFFKLIDFEGAEKYSVGYNQKTFEISLEGDDFGTILGIWFSKNDLVNDPDKFMQSVKCLEGKIELKKLISILNKMRNYFNRLNAYKLRAKKCDMDLYSLRRFSPKSFLNIDPLNIDLPDIDTQSINIFWLASSTFLETSETVDLEVLEGLISVRESLLLSRSKDMLHNPSELGRKIQKLKIYQDLGIKLNNKITQRATTIKSLTGVDIDVLSDDLLDCDFAKWYLMSPEELDLQYERLDSFHKKYKKLYSYVKKMYKKSPEMILLKNRLKDRIQAKRDWINGLDEKSIVTIKEVESYFEFKSQKLNIKSDKNYRFGLRKWLSGLINNPDSVAGELNDKVFDEKGYISKSVILRRLDNLERFLMENIFMTGQCKSAIEGFMVDFYQFKSQKRMITNSKHVLDGARL